MLWGVTLPKYAERANGEVGLRDRASTKPNLSSGAPDELGLYVIQRTFMLDIRSGDSG